MRPLGCVLGAIALCACGGDEGGVLFVAIDTEIAIPDAIDDVEVIITASRDDSGRLCRHVSRHFELEQQDDLPIVIGVETGETYSSWVAIRATGRRGDDIVVSRDRLATLPDAGEWNITVMLEAACAHVQCPRDEHCVEGVCDVVPMPGVFDEPSHLDEDVSCIEEER